MADEYKYDVFISYSHKDEGWAVDTLLPALEDVSLKTTQKIVCSSCAPWADLANRH